MEKPRASRTAVLACQGRAVAGGRIVPDRFGDGIAALLVTPDEHAMVARARDDAAPLIARERLAWERLRACAEGVVPRTVLIDEALQPPGQRQFVIVGGGLDTRPWRLAEPESTTVSSRERDRLTHHAPSLAGKRSVAVATRALRRSVQRARKEYFGSGRRQRRPRQWSR